MSNITSLANGIGYIYVTAADGASLITNLANNDEGKIQSLSMGLTSAPLYGNVSSYGVIEFGGIDDDVTGLTVDGVSIISGVITASGTIAGTVALVANDINTFASTPEYTSLAIGTVLYIFADPIAGSGPNGLVVACASGTMTTTITDMTGGTDTTGVTDDVTGNRFYLDATAGAVEGTISGSEITSYLTMRGLQTSLPNVETVISSGHISITRTSSITVATVETQGGAAADDLNTILTTGFNLGDYIVFRGYDPTHIVTFKNYSGGSDNLLLAAATDYITGTVANSIVLQLTSVAGNLRWAEISRTPNLTLSVASLRTAGISIPVQGVTSTALTLNAQTITLTPGTSKEFQRITGTGVLLGNVTVNFGGTPKDGDFFFIDYQATITKGVWAISLGGLTLTTTQAIEGNYVIYSYYDLTATVWRSHILKDTLGEDLVDTVQLATKEDLLGNPAIDGYVLQSTTTGTRSWRPSGVAIVLYDVTSNNQTTAVIRQESLKTYAVPALTMATDGTNGSGSVMRIEAIYQTAANANAKTVSIDFGATTLISATGNFNAETILLECVVTRIDVNNQSAWGRVTTSSGIFDVLYTLPGENLAADFDVIANGQNGVAVANDIINRKLTVTLT